MSASAVSTVCRLIGPLAILPLLSFQSHAAPPDGYYAAAEGKKGNELKAALHAIVAPHQTVSYDGLWKAYETTDANGEGKPLCTYSEFPFDSFEQKRDSEPGKIGSYLTREHSFPKDWWGGTKNAAYSDLFHVILGDAHVNGQKGVKPLGEVDLNGKTFGISRVGKARQGLGYAGQVFEPADRYKGDFARNYLYMSICYLEGQGHLDCSSSPMVMPDGTTFKPWAVRLLKKWHREDPPGERELKRNDAVFALQKNRNPFIDHPEYVDAIWPEEGRRGMLAGADPNYTLGMEKAGKTWLSGGQSADVFKILGSSGLDMVRVRLWTKDKGANGLEEATVLMKRAKEANLKLYVTLFLSEDWADYVKQPAPAIWKDLPFDEKVRAVNAYAEQVARHFKEQGLDVDYYEIGNEIDFGICGEFETEWGKRVSMDHMKEAIWPKMAKIIGAAQGGIKKVRPEAKFILHLTQWWNPEYCIAFFKTMGSSGVTVDVAGLSFFPTSNLSKENSMDYFLTQTGKLAEATRRPVMICEFGYPSEPKFTGQFAEWNCPVAGYTLDEEGQAKWLADFLARSDEAGFIDGVFYWSPEWYDSDMWSAFSLFDAKGEPKKALSAFRAGK